VNVNVVFSPVSSVADLFSACQVFINVFHYALGFSLGGTETMLPGPASESS
jgi:nickel-dependent lactate racemase